jgi:hypothetical protein
VTRGARMTHMRRMTRRCWMVAGVTVAVGLAGCATRETVLMQHPQTNEVVQCAEGYRRLLGGQGYQPQEDCIADYQRQGYERPPAPGK